MPEERQSRPDGLVTALGWFSIGLGTAQLVAPAAISRVVGFRPTTGTARVMRAMGMRELASGIGVLRSGEPARFLWARAAGDGLDAALLAGGIRDRGASTGRLAMALVGVGGAAAMDVVAAKRSSNGAAPASSGADDELDRPRFSELRATTTLSVSPQEAYSTWRDFEGLPRFMAHLESVTPMEGDDQRTHWIARGPAGTTVAWDAVITDDIPGERIVWRSVEGASVPNQGSVQFRSAPGGRGTEVRVEVSYSPPGGAVGAAVARLFGEEPSQQVRDDLRRFKQLVETGEVARSDGSPAGLRTKNLLRRRPAAPLEEIDLRNLDLEGVRT